MKREIPDYVTEYYNKMKSGEIIVSSWILKFYENHLMPIVRGESEKYCFNKMKGYMFIEFVETFCVQSKDKWAGKPLKLLLFQKAKWQAVFGILWRKTKRRRFQEIFDTRGRKNGKTVENAALGIFMTILEPGAETYAVATTASQARITWEASVEMIQKSSYLSEAFKWKVFPKPEIDTTSKKRAKGSYYAMPNKAENLDGLNVSCTLIDEVHALKREIYDIFKQGTSARTQPLMSIIGSNGFVRGGLYDDEIEYSKKVIDGLVEDDTLFPLLYIQDDLKEIEDETKWVKSNPAIDVIKDRQKLRGFVERMKSDVNFRNTVLTKDFNYTGVSNKSWYSGDMIMKGRFGKYSEFEVGLANSEVQKKFLKRFDGQIVVGGFDLSKTRDMTAFTTLLFDNGTIIAKTMYFVPQSFFELDYVKASKINYKAWVDRGLIRISGETQISYSDIADYVMEEINEHGYIYQFIGYDSWSASYLVEDFQSRGFAKGYCLKPVRQGAQTLNLPISEVDALIEAKRFCFLNNPVTQWCFSNVEMRIDEKNKTKQPIKSGEKEANKIDGYMTILDAIAVYFENQQNLITQCAKNAVDDNQ